MELLAQVLANGILLGGLYAVMALGLALVWGVHPVPFEEVHDLAGMVEHAASAALAENFGQAGDVVVVIAGLPFGRSGSTNLLHVARIPG